MFRLLSPILFGAMIYLLVLMFFDSISMLDENFFSREILFTIGLTYLFLELNRLVIVAFNYFFAHEKRLQFRIPLQFLASFVVSIAVVSVILYTYFIYVEGFSTINTELITFNALFILFALFYHLFFFSLVYLTHENETKVENEKILRAGLDAELQTFKNQINPDLLFQSLEIIISELHHDKKVADDLIDKLSKVYRYALDNKHNDLVSLEKEISMIQPLADIFKTKYGDDFDLVTNVDEKLHLNLVPGTLQILLEDALSENIISKSLKLQIEIDAKADFVEFKYRSHPKIRRIFPQNQRMAYLRKTYSYFSDKGLDEYKTEEQIIYRIPLLSVEEEG